MRTTRKIRTWQKKLGKVGKLRNTSKRSANPPSDDLRRHPVRRSDHRASTVALRRDLSTEPEVCEFHLALHPEQDVVTLDVAVDDVSRVQELQGLV